jgi:hypothetical protein
MLKSYSFVVLLLSLSSFFFTGCLTASKMDKYVASQFNDKLPKPDKKNDSSILITSSLRSDPDIISVTEKKTKNILPLIVYWQYDYRHTCVLNPAIGVANFRKTTYQQAKKLKQKLNGQQLELIVEQIPRGFAIVDKGALLLFVIHWDELYVEPDPKDLVVSYRVVQNGTESKSGKITVKSIEKSKGIRYFQSWKSCASEFLVQYNLDIAEMTKTVVNKLADEL